MKINKTLVLQLGPLKLTISGNNRQPKGISLPRDTSSEPTLDLSTSGSNALVAVGWSVTSPRLAVSGGVKILLNELRTDNPKICSILAQNEDVETISALEQRAVEMASAYLAAGFSVITPFWGDSWTRLYRKIKGPDHDRLPLLVWGNSAIIAAGQARNPKFKPSAKAAMHHAYLRSFSRTLFQNQVWLEGFEVLSKASMKAPDSEGSQPLTS